jgi:hypothetical protein
MAAIYRAWRPRNPDRAVMTHVSCTLFDHRYMSRGLAMIRSLRRVVPDAQIWVLCLDQAALDLLHKIKEPGLHPVPLADFEAGDPELMAAKSDGRTPVEYYFSAKPSLISHVMRVRPDVEWVTYLDADLFFFSDPAPLFSETENASVLITPHGFPEPGRERERFGRFNAGWISFRRSAEGLSALQWWRTRCLEWCFDRIDEPNNRFADQRYLDQLAKSLPGVHSVRHPGANLAPWNVSGHHLALRNGAILVDGDSPLVFFHAHGVREAGKNFYIVAQDPHCGPPDRVLREGVYRPYLTILRSIGRKLRPLMPTAAAPLRRPSQKASRGRLETFKAGLRIVRAFSRGTLMRVPE